MEIYGLFHVEQAGVAICACYSPDPPLHPGPLVPSRTTWKCHYSDVIISGVASQITGVSVAYSTVCSGVDQRNHRRSASRAFMRGIHRSSVNSPPKGPVARRMFQSDIVTMVVSHFVSFQVVICQTLLSLPIAQFWMRYVSVLGALCLFIWFFYIQNQPKYPLRCNAEKLTLKTWLFAEHYSRNM